MEAPKHYLDMEAATSNQSFSSSTGSDTPVYRRWAVMGSVAAFMLMSVFVGFGKAAGTEASVNKHATAFTTAFAPGLRPRIGHMHAHDHKRVVRRAPIRLTMNDADGMHPNFAAMKAGALKTLMTERGVSTVGCFDKEGLLERAEQNRALLGPQKVAGKGQEGRQRSNSAKQNPEYGKQTAAASGPASNRPPVDNSRQNQSPGIAQNFYETSTSDFKRPYGSGGGAQPSAAAASAQPPAPSPSPQPRAAGKTLNFAEMKAGALKTLLKERGVYVEDCFDKSELLKRAEQHRDLLESPPKVADTGKVGGQRSSSAKAGFGASEETPIPGREKEYHEFMKNNPGGATVDNGPRKKGPAIDNDRANRSPGMARNFYDTPTDDFKKSYSGR